MNASALAWAMEERCRLARELALLSSSQADRLMAAYFHKRIAALDAAIDQLGSARPPAQPPRTTT
jgi:hypothetical protein